VATVIELEVKMQHCQICALDIGGQTPPPKPMAVILDLHGRHSDDRAL